MKTEKDIWQAGDLTGNENEGQSVQTGANEEARVVHVLWTGGLASTARIVELSRMEVTVQPYYIVDFGWKPTLYEESAMQKIREHVFKGSRTLAKIQPVKEIFLEEVKPCPQITNAWKALHDRYRVDRRYEFLARYAKQHGTVLELCVGKGEESVQNSIRNESKMIPFTGPMGESFRISEADSTEAAKTLYENFTFPLWEKDMRAEVRMMERYGCGDIAAMTWFCHTPLLGEPCGHCAPCRSARRYGFLWQPPVSRTILWGILHPEQAGKIILRKTLGRTS